MITKDELYRILNLDTFIDAKVSQLKDLEFYRDMLPPTTFGDKIQTSGKSDLTSETAIKIIQMQHDINDQIDEMIDLKKRAMKAFEMLEGYESALMELRYINHLTWYDVSDKLGYSLRQCHRIHGQALCKLEECFRQ